MPTLRQLRYFVTVAEELHFGRAAERLHMTQPPLSQQIQTLERRLEMTLFDRDRRNVRLTPEGRFFLDEARAILSQVETGVRRAKEVRDGIRGTLGIGFVGSSGFVVLPTIMRHFAREFPQVRLALTEMTTAQQWEALRSGGIDIGIGREHSGNPEFLELRVAREPFVAAVPSSHPLCGGSGWIALEELARDPFVLYPRELGPRFYDKIVALCMDAGFSPRLAQEAVHIQTHVNLVAAGIGVSLLPASVRVLQPAGVRFLKLTSSRVQTETYLLRVRSDSRPLPTTFMSTTSRLFGEDPLGHPDDPVRSGGGDPDDPEVL